MPAPVGPLCQTDLGGASSAKATLTVCGDPIVEGNTNTQLVISGAPPYAASRGVRSSTSNAS